MPIFEFKCLKCGYDFEELVRDGKKIKCPKCESAKINKKFSTFCKNGGSEASLSSGGSACSSCSSGNCGSCGAA